jgi:hypothetical protein
VLLPLFITDFEQVHIAKPINGQVFEKFGQQYSATQTHGFSLDDIGLPVLAEMAEALGYPVALCVVRCWCCAYKRLPNMGSINFERIFYVLEHDSRIFFDSVYRRKFPRHYPVRLSNPVLVTEP